MCRTGDSSSMRCQPLARAVARGRLILQNVFSLRFTEVTARGPHVSPSISQRAFSSGLKGKIQLPELACAAGELGSLPSGDQGAQPFQATCGCLVGLSSPRHCFPFPCSASGPRGMSKLPSQAFFVTDLQHQPNNHLARRKR